MNLRKVVDQERLYYILDCYRKLIRAKIVSIDPHLEDKLEIFSRQAGKSFIPAWIRSVNRELGDPLVIHKTGLRHMAIPYWNPTPLRINIFSLGILKADLGVYEFVEPGERVLIPWGYCQGGKYSAVKGVAPQLQPLPTPKHDLQDYDLMPISYQEWITYFGMSFSQCCRKQILWDEKHARCVCQKCYVKVNA